MTEVIICTVACGNYDMPVVAFLAIIVFSFFFLLKQWSTLKNQQST